MRACVCAYVRACGAFVYTHAYKIIPDIFHRQISEFLALFSELQAASCNFRCEILRENAIGCGEWYYLHTWTTGFGEMDEGRGESVRRGPPRCRNDSILMKDKSGSARSVNIIRAVL